MNNEEFLDIMQDSLVNIPLIHRAPYGSERTFERLFAYELYHQMRLRWPNNERLVLHGELPKEYRDIAEEPDIVCHIPNSDELNLAVIEVKPARSGASEIKKDLNKLHQFISPPLGYIIGIEVVFGSLGQLSRARRVILEDSHSDGKEIFIFWVDCSPDNGGVEKDIVVWETTS